MPNIYRNRYTRLDQGNPDTGRALIEAIGTRRFRPYLTDDVVGAQLGGILASDLVRAAMTADRLAAASGAAVRAAVMTETRAV